jgi:hypothetical protein
MRSVPVVCRISIYSMTHSEVGQPVTSNTSLLTLICDYQAANVSNVDLAQLSNFQNLWALAG